MSAGGNLFAAGALLAITVILIVIMLWQYDPIISAMERYRNPDAMADPNMYSFGPVYYMPPGPLPAGFGN